MIDMMEELEENPEKVIKCILLRNHYWLITEVQELRVDYELNIPNCKLIKPYQIDTTFDFKNRSEDISFEDAPTVRIGNSLPQCKYEIYPWKEFTNDDEILIFSEYIVTIVEPKPELLEAYIQATE